MKHQEIAKVLANVKVAPEHYRLTLLSNKISRESLPGQFIMARCSDGTDPLLRRPISLNRIDTAKGTIDILFRVAGNGTRLLSEKDPGSDIDIIGPLGNGFKIDPNKQVAILVGGGAGIAPLLSVAKDLTRKTKANYALIGANSRDSVLLENDFKDLGFQTAVSTDDGSYGTKGTVVDILMSLVSSNFSPANAQIFACGPKPMIRALEDVAMEYKVPCQVSLEEWMACGVGSCFGCTVKTKQGYKKVCSDGPIFNAGDILW